MKKFFPRYVAKIEYSCTEEEFMNKLLKTVNELPTLHVTKIYRSDLETKVVLDTKTEYDIARNSFMPTVTINMKTTEEKTNVFASFELRKDVKIFIIVFLIFLLGFEVAMVMSMIYGNGVTAWLLFIPFGLAVFIYMLSTLGLIFSSKMILKTMNTGDVNTGDGSMIDNG